MDEFLVFLRRASPVVCLSQGDRNFSALTEVNHNHLDNFNIPNFLFFLF